MKINYNNTIEKLKQANLILPTDVYAVGQDTPSTSMAVMFGAIGAALSSKNYKNYIFSANTDEIRIFDIDKNTGEYLNTLTPILKTDIVKLKVGTGLGKFLKIKCSNFSINYTFGNKFKGFDQKENLAAFLNLIKNSYTK